jgi:murein DD-endopeptidase MepM/ murein hydrolase activator NlpD
MKKTLKLIKKHNSLICCVGFFVAGGLYNYMLNVNNHSFKKVKLVATNQIISIETPNVLIPIKELKTLKEEKNVPMWEKNNIFVKKGDSFFAILAKYKVSNNLIYKISEKIKKHDKKYMNLSIGSKIDLNFKDGNLFSFDLYKDKIDFLKVIINNTNDIVLYEDSLPTIKEKFVVKGVIKNSLYADGLSAGLTDGQVVELANIFAWDIDFARDLATGNKFSLIYEKIKHGKEVVSYGKILAATFETQRGKFHAFSYKEKDNLRYYDLNGKSIEKAFIRSPVKFPRITSKFTYKRYHPVLKINRPHRGVDYGGRRGTPIMATGSGTISHIGKKGAYGNAIVIEHGLGYKTLYAHMTKFKKGLKKGGKIKQSQVIGYMGATGLATGVHLHYEFRINNKHKDPLKIKLPDGRPVSDLIGFNAYKKELLTILNLDKNGENQNE